MASRTHIRSIGTATGLALIVLMPSSALGHCDGWDGPVVKAAQRALETRNAALVLMWVQPTDEDEIRKAFDQTLAVRELGLQAQRLADQFFFETVVRIHRASEGAPFTGLKPAGLKLGPAIPAADKAVDTGSIEPVLELLTDAVDKRVRQHFGDVIAAKRFNAGDVAAGRVYVNAYVEFVHLVERLYEAAATAPHGHFEERDTRGIDH